MRKVLLTFIYCLLLTPAFLLAQAGGGGTPGAGGTGNPPVGVNVVFKNPFAVGSNLYDLAKAIVDKIILPIGGVLCVLAFIYAGFIYVTARGKEAQITKAHNALLFAAVGTAVLLGAWMLATVVENTIKALMT